MVAQTIIVHLTSRRPGIRSLLKGHTIVQAPQVCQSQDLGPRYLNHVLGLVVIRDREEAESSVSVAGTEGELRC